MIKYSLTMGIRFVCVVLCVFARGWWLAVFACGAVFLPYIAVVIANVSQSRPSPVQRPGIIVPLPPPQTGPSEASRPPESERPA
jgi:hypothetical protein